MDWSDEGVVLAGRRHGENALIVQLLTRDRGRHAGLVRHGQGPKTRGTFEIGNRVLVTWKARLAEHLGTITGEALHCFAPAFMNDPLRLGCLSAAAALAETVLPEREPHRRAFDALVRLFEALERDEGWAVAMVDWEMLLLAELGFGLDLGTCAATGSTEDLVYVSPKSGQAVSAAAGEPYRDRLLRLPPFLVPGDGARRAAPADVLDGLAVTGHFLDRRILAPESIALPAARSRFVDALRRLVTISGS